MIPRIIEIDNPAIAARELRSLGCDKTGVEIMVPKAVCRAVKLKNIRPVAANIIKQGMLSFGGEAATAYGAVNQSVRTTDVLVFGTQKQLSLLVKKLGMHQFGLPEIAVQIQRALSNYDSVPRSLKVGHRTLEIGLQTYIMGILNVTPDSFSDPGRFFGVSEAIAYGEEMMEAGADIIDVGGESTRPGARPVPAQEETERVIPVIKALSKKKGMIISIDTRKAKVAQAALDAGARIVNDVTGLRFDKKMAKVVAAHKVPVSIMHMRGTPATMQKNPVYGDLMGEIVKYLEESIAIAENAGILHGKIIVDPGIGFGKTVENNLEILKRLREFKVLGCPILVGPSRKSTIGKVLNLPEGERVEGTAAAVAVSIANGADFVRVHDVKEMVRVARMTDAIIRRQ